MKKQNNYKTSGLRDSRTNNILIDEVAKHLM